MAILQPRDYTLHAAGAETVTGNGNRLLIPAGFTACIVRVDSAAGDGTSPTLDLYLQVGIKDVAATDTENQFSTGGYVFNDLLAFAQITTASEQWAYIVGGGSQVAAAQSGALSAGTILDGPIGGVWRLRWVIGGTGPSFLFDVSCQLIP